MWQNPQQGAPGLSQGQTTPAQVPFPRKLEEHVSISGVTPDMHPGTVAPLFMCSSLQWAPFPCSLLQILLQMPPLDRLGLENPWQGIRGRSSGCMGTGCPSLLRAALGHAMALSTTAAMRAPFSAVLGMEPGTGSRAAAGRPVLSGDPLTPLGPKFSEPSPCHSDAGVSCPGTGTRTRTHGFGSVPGMLPTALCRRGFHAVRPCKV